MMVLAGGELVAGAGMTALGTSVLTLCRYEEHGLTTGAQQSGYSD